MAINYNPTKWENGKTILKASHFEKIEKGITDIINYNNSIYADEDKRKENEIKREEEYNKKIKEVDTLVDNLKSDYDSLEKIIIDENASVNLQNQINDVTSQLAHIGKQIHPSGSDDTKAIQDAINNYNNVLLFEGEFILSDTLQLRKGVKLFGVNKEKTRLKYNIDINCVNITGNSELFNLTFEVPQGFSNNVINCQSWKMDSVDNGKIHNINIRQTNENTSPTGKAINLEVASTLGGHIYFTNFMFRDIDIKGYWENGINNTIHYASDNDPTWLTVVKFENIFINTAKNSITFNYTNKNNIKLTFPRANSFSDFYFKNVSTQYIQNKSEKFLILSNINRSRFDMCLPWDFDTKKPYTIKCDDDVRVAIHDILFTADPITVIDFVNGDDDNYKNLNRHLTSWATIDGRKYEEDLRIKPITNPDTYVLNKSIFKPVYFRSNQTSSQLGDVFIGSHFESNNIFGGNYNAYSFDFGIDGSNNLVYRYKTSDGWSDFINVTTGRYAPNGSTSSRPSNPRTGFMYFDTSKGRPAWWNGVAWVDANGVGI